LAQVRRDLEAFELWAQGRTYATVAERMGYKSASGAHKAVERIRARCEVEDRALSVRVEWTRLEALHGALWPLLDDARRGDGAVRRLLQIGDLRAELTGDFTVDLPALGRRSPAHVTGVWTEALTWRAAGVDFATIARRLRLSDRSAARRRVAAELDAFVAGPVNAHRVTAGERLDELQCKIWDRAVGARPRFEAVDAVLKIIGNRIRLLGLASEPVEEEATPPRNPRETIILHGGHR
jgi:hypothetical protein